MAFKIHVYQSGCYKVSAPPSKKPGGSLFKKLLKAIKNTFLGFRTYREKTWKEVIDVECKKIAQSWKRQQHDEQFIEQAVQSNLVGVYSSAKDKVAKYYVANRLRVPISYFRDIGVVALNIGLPGDISADCVFTPKGVGMNIYLSLIKEAVLQRLNTNLSGPEKEYAEKKLIEIITPYALKQGWIEPQKFQEQLAVVGERWWPEITRF